MKNFKDFLNEKVEYGEGHSYYSKYTTVSGHEHGMLSTYKKKLPSGKTIKYQYEGNPYDKKVASDPHAKVNVMGHGFMKLSDAHKL